MAKAKPIQGMDPEAPLLANAALIINTRLQEMLDFERYLADPDNVYELHQMRIGAKRLRYTMEMFQEAYSTFSADGQEFAKAIEEIKKLQELLGEIHDADVLVPQLLDHLALLIREGHGKDKKGLPVAGVHRVDAEACEGLLAVCRAARDERDVSRKNLQEVWDRLTETRYFDNLRSLLDRAATGDSGEPTPAETETAPKPAASRRKTTKQPRLTHDIASDVAS